jgi:hypothetical protein
MPTYHGSWRRNCDPGTDPKTWKEHKSEFEAGAKSAGKEVSKMPVLVEQHVVAGDNRDEERAADLWRFGPNAFKSYYNIRDPKEIPERADCEVPLEQDLRRLARQHRSAVLARAITELFDSGATIVNIHSGQEAQKCVIESYGKEVLPPMKHRRFFAPWGDCPRQRKSFLPHRSFALQATDHATQNASGRMRWRLERGPVHLRNRAAASTAKRPVSPLKVRSAGKRKAPFVLEKGARVAL